MKRKLSFVILNFIYWLSLFIFQKPVFLLFQLSQSKEESLSDLFGVIFHGFCMDISTSGYFAALPLLITLVSCFTPTFSWVYKATKIYTYLTIPIVSLIFTADLFLYENWGFRIDSSLLFYLQTPKDAMASITWNQILMASVVLAFTIILSIKWYSFTSKIESKISETNESKGYDPFSAIPIILLAGLLFIGIRGGVGVSTMNAGRVYFSESPFLNHAALNPIWNFIYSCSHNTKFEEQYRFMEDKQACELLNELNQTSPSENPLHVLKKERPNVFLIIMEGMGSNIIETLGGEKGVTPNLSKYTKEGIVFTNFFANAIRTDRGLTSILSAYPAQPTNSVMKDSKKIQNIPIITQNFKAAGYETAFYYGGDDNFTNLRSYLITAGYQTIINEKNFDGNEISTKWGAYDHILFQKIKKDLNQKRLENRLNSQLFYTILTLNSHEPFDVPINVLEDRYLNSAYYADSCIGDFIETVRNSELWENSLIVILPDHSFRYPYNLSNSEPYRYRIPLIWLGGAIKEQPMEVEKTCGQVDLAATLLNQLDMEHADFVFSHDIFAPSHPQYAFFSYPDGFGFINKTDTALYDCGANKTIRTTNEKTLQQGKAYLQKLYDDLSKR